jgi:hypothetical protein
MDRNRKGLCELEKFEMPQKEKSISICLVKTSELEEATVTLMTCRAVVGNFRYVQRLTIEWSESTMVYRCKKGREIESSGLPLDEGSSDETTAQSSKICSFGEVRKRPRRKRPGTRETAVSVRVRRLVIGSLRPGIRLQLMIHL